MCGDDSSGVVSTNTFLTDAIKLCALATFFLATGQRTLHLFRLSLKGQMVQDSCFRNRTRFSVRGEKTLFVARNGKANIRVLAEGTLESTAALYYVGKLFICESKG